MLMAESKTLNAKPKFLVTIAVGPHLFPFRTEKLSPPALMVLFLRLGRESKSSPVFFCLKMKISQPRSEDLPNRKDAKNISNVIL